jgi:hypothetical protein
MAGSSRESVPRFDEERGGCLLKMLCARCVFQNPGITRHRGRECLLAGLLDQRHELRLSPRFAPALDLHRGRHRSEFLHGQASEVRLSRPDALDLGESMAVRVHLHQRRSHQHSRSHQFKKSFHNKTIRSEIRAGNQVFEY